MLKERFKITDDSKANWAFRKIAEKELELKENEVKFEEFQKQNEEWKERVNNPLEVEIEYYKGLLEEYRLTLDDKKINVPAGQTIVRHSKKPQYSDEKLLKFIQKNHPEYIKPTIAKGDFRKAIKPVEGGKYIDEDGQIVEGIEWNESETVSYKTN